MTTEYILLLFIIFILSLIFLAKWKGKKQQSHPSPPSLPSLPIVGSLPFLRSLDNISVFFAKKSHELGPVFTFRVGSKLMLTLNNKEAIEEALVRNSRSFSSRPEIFMQKIINPNSKGIREICSGRFRFCNQSSSPVASELSMGWPELGWLDSATLFDIYGGLGIGFRDFSPKWKIIHHHSLTVLKEFGFGDVSIMEERIMREVEAMVDFVRSTGGKPFDPKELFLLAISNVMMNIVFASRRSYDLGISKLMLEIDQYSHLMNMIFDIAPFLKYIPPFKNRISEMKSCCRKIHDILQTEFETSLRNKKTCFVSEYIRKEGPTYDYEELYFTVRDFIAAGTDTIANTMRWAMIALVNHPEIQKKLQQEIDSVISRDRFPTMQDQKKLPYVEATIHEIFRWRTLVPLSIAHYTKEDSVVKDFFIPAGTLVFPNLYAAHNDITMWKDPDVFRPERFLDKENNVFGLDRVITFSLGRRSCIGESLARAEIFLILTSFLQRFTVLPPEGQDKICDQPAMPVTLLSVPDSFSIRLVERQ